MVVLRLIGGLSLRRARSACRWFPTHCSEVPLLARPSPSAKDRFLALPARSSDGCFRAAKGRFDPFATPQRMAANCAHRTARADEFRSLMGQGGCPSWVSTPWGCLCSLRARSALDGVSWVQGGLVEGALGRWSAACNAVLCSRARASLLAGALCDLLSGIDGLSRHELRFVPQVFCRISPTVVLSENCGKGITLTETRNGLEESIVTVLTRGRGILGAG